jgi:hypothetical protein
MTRRPGYPLDTGDPPPKRLHLDKTTEWSSPEKKRKQSTRRRKDRFTKSRPVKHDKPNTRPLDAGARAFGRRSSTSIAHARYQDMSLSGRRCRGSADDSLFSATKCRGLMGSAQVGIPVPEVNPHAGAIHGGDDTRRGPACPNAFLLCPETRRGERSPDPSYERRNDVSHDRLPAPGHMSHFHKHGSDLATHVSAGRRRWGLAILHQPRHRFGTDSAERIRYRKAFS